jgi:rhamnosyltransferase
MEKSKSKKINVTIAVPTYNGADYLDDLIGAVFSQKTNLVYEMLVIDSGSSDRTLEIIKKYPEVKLHEIPNSDFGHGKTRNLASKMANGDFIVFLSQDAVPATSKWLEYMIEPFYISDKVFCVVGKQTPRAHCDATTKREVSLAFAPLGPDHTIMLHRGKSLITQETIVPALTFFSDVNSAVRLDYIRNIIPYRDIEYAEDQLLGKDVLDAGYIKVYAPSGNVIHSNEYPISKYFNRRIDEFNAMQKFMNLKPESRIPSLMKLYIIDTLKDILFTLKDKDYTLLEKIINFAESIVRNAQKQIASYIVGKSGKNGNISKYSLEAKERRRN